MSNASSENDVDVDPTANINFIVARDSASFKNLKKDHRSFVFPLAMAFLVWYLLYVILAIYAPEFMATPVFGKVNLGIILGLLQFVTTFAITGWYVTFANRRMDPQAATLRQNMEAGVYPLEKSREG